LFGRDFDVCLRFCEEIAERRVPQYLCENGESGDNGRKKNKVEKTENYGVNHVFFGFEETIRRKLINLRFPYFALLKGEA
jgi:hypothetical protein